MYTPPVEDPIEKERKSLRNMALAVTILGGLAMVGGLFFAGISQIITRLAGSEAFDAMGGIGKFYEQGATVGAVQGVWGLFTLITGIYLRQFANWARIAMQGLMLLAFVGIWGGVFWFIVNNDMPLMEGFTSMVYVISGLMYSAPIPFFVYHLNKPKVKAFFEE